MDHDNQPDKYNHKVLTVGNIPGQSRDVGPVLHGLNIEFIHVDTAVQAAGTVEKAPAPFSLVICDQRLEGMKGTALLARVKKMSPETIRFLLTRYADMKTINSAINTGAVHRYISMPWKESQMAEAVAWGILRYEYELESNAPFSLAKKQNGKLYELNCELMETARYQGQKSKTLEREIAGLKANLKEKTASRPMSPEKLAALICHAVQHTGDDAGEMLNLLYTQSIIGLYSAFNDLAMRNGIEMPVPAPEDRHD